MITVISENHESKTTSDSAKREVVIESDKRLARRSFDEKTYHLFEKTKAGLEPRGTAETGLLAVRFVRGRDG